MGEKTVVYIAALHLQECSTRGSDPARQRALFGPRSKLKHKTGPRTVILSSKLYINLLGYPYQLG